MIPIAGNINIKMVQNWDHMFPFQDRRLSGWRKDIPAEYSERRKNLILRSLLSIFPLGLCQDVRELADELDVAYVVLSIMIRP